MAIVTVELEYENWKCGKPIVSGKDEGTVVFEQPCGHEDCTGCNGCLQMPSPEDCPEGSGPFIKIVDGGCTTEQLVSIEQFIDQFMNEAGNDDEVSVDSEDVPNFLESQLKGSNCIRIDKVAGGDDGTKVLQFSFDMECFKNNVSPTDIFGEADPCQDEPCDFQDVYDGFDEAQCDECDESCRFVTPTYCPGNKTTKWECSPFDRPELETVCAKTGYNSKLIEHELGTDKIYYISERNYDELDVLGRNNVGSMNPTTKLRMGYVTAKQGNVFINVPQIYEVRVNVAAETTPGITARRVGAMILRAKSDGGYKIIYGGQHRLGGPTSKLLNDNSSELEKRFGIPRGYDSQSGSDDGISLNRHIGRMSANSASYELLLPCDVIVPFVKISTSVNEYDPEVNEYNRGGLFLIGQDVDTYGNGGSPFTLEVTSVGNIVTASTLIKRHGMKCFGECEY